jgi:hypothetical protein
MKLLTEKIGGYDIEIHVDTRGDFSATFNENDYEAKTQVALIEQLTAAVKKAALQHPVNVTVLGLVPNTQRNEFSSSSPYRKGAGFVHAQLKARHQRQSGVWLLRTEDGRQKFQVGSYSNDGTIARRLTVEETVEYMRLATALVDAQRALDEFTTAVKISPQAELDAAKAGAK